MIDYLIMYFLVVAENLKPFFTGWWSVFPGIIGVLSMIVYFLLQIVRITNYGDGWREDVEEVMYKKVSPWFVRSAVIFCSLSVFMQFMGAATPNMKQVAIIYIVPKIINNPNVQQLPDNVLIFFNEGLKELTSVIKGEAKQIAGEISQTAKDKAVEAMGSMKSSGNNEEKKR